MKKFQLRVPFLALIFISLVIGCEKDDGLETMEVELADQEAFVVDQNDALDQLALLMSGAIKEESIRKIIKKQAFGGNC